MIRPKPKPAKGSPPPRKRSKSERQLLEKQLYDLTSIYVRRRDGKCVTCGTTAELTMSHWQKAGKQRARYDLRNVNAQCARCNQLHNRWTGPYNLYMEKHYSSADRIEINEWASINEWKWPVIELRQMVKDIYAQVCGVDDQYSKRVDQIIAKNDTWNEA